MNKLILLLLLSIMFLPHFVLSANETNTTIINNITIENPQTFEINSPEFYLILWFVLLIIYIIISYTLPDSEIINIIIGLIMFLLTLFMFDTELQYVITFSLSIISLILLIRYYKE